MILFFYRHETIFCCRETLAWDRDTYAKHIIAQLLQQAIFLDELRQKFPLRNKQKLLYMRFRFVLYRRRSTRGRQIFPQLSTLLSVTIFFASTCFCLDYILFDVSFGSAPLRKCGTRTPIACGTVCSRCCGLRSNFHSSLVKIFCRDDEVGKARRKNIAI